MRELALLRQALKGLEENAAQSSVAGVADSQALEKLQNGFEQCSSTLCSLIESLAKETIPAVTGIKGFSIFSPSDTISNAHPKHPWPISVGQAATLRNKLRGVRRTIADFISSDVL
jgi:hypothetical protein